MSEQPAARTQAPAQMASVPWESELANQIRGQFPASSFQFQSYLGQNFILCSVSDLLPLLQHLHEDHQFDYLVDLTAVDCPKQELRFELVYIVYSFSRNERLRVKTRVAESEAATSVVSLFQAANWLEREVFDMFGIPFSGHPNLKRILMPDDWSGYPLRKDYSIIGMDNQWVQNNLGIESGQ
jgi:NADH-quinone oxidoreductase subunit C